VKPSKLLIFASFFLLGCNIAKAQFNDFLNYPLTVAPHESPDSTRGHFWGYMFGSYFDKVHADTLGRGNTQYSGSTLEKGSNEFSLERVYLGYDYFFNAQFSVHAVMAYEETNDNAFGAVTTLQNYDRSFYLKYANMEWTNMFNTGLKLSVGAITTPSFAITEEPFWGYRSIDRTIMDMKGITGSNDFGVNIGGKIWRKKDDAGNENACVGFNFMVGNSTGAIPDVPGITSNYTTWKKYYGNLYVKLFNDKVLLDLYGDGHTFSWTDIPANGVMHQYEVTGRIFLGYKTKNFNISAEYFKQLEKNMVDEVSGPGVPASGDTADNIQSGYSIMTAVVLLRDKKTGASKLTAFARYDYYNPDNTYNSQIYYEPGGMYVDGQKKNVVIPWIENYFVIGLDFQPIKQIHFMPNLWYDGIHDQSYNSIPATPLQKFDYDLVPRITFYYQFFKN